MTRAVKGAAFPHPQIESKASTPTLVPHQQSTQLQPLVSFFRMQRWLRFYALPCSQTDNHDVPFSPWFGTFALLILGVLYVLARKDCVYHSLFRFSHDRSSGLLDYMRHRVFRQIWMRISRNGILFLVFRAIYMRFLCEMEVLMS